jgi:hypothetical protein
MRVLHAGMIVGPGRLQRGEANNRFGDGEQLWTEPD